MILFRLGWIRNRGPLDHGTSWDQRLGASIGLVHQRSRQIRGAVKTDRTFGSLAPPISSHAFHRQTAFAFTSAICYLLFSSRCSVNLKSALTLIFVLGFVYSPLASFAQEPAQAPEPIQVGVFIVSTFNVDPNKGSYTVLFYIWSIGPLDDPDPLSSIQFPRAITTTLLSQNQRIRGNTRWILKSYRCSFFG